MQTIRLLWTALLLLPDALSALRIPNQRIVTVDTIPSLDRFRVPGESPAYHCADPSNDLFNISRLDFIPTNPRIGYYLTTRFIGNFTSPTGDLPWLNITGSINGRPERGPMYYSPLCDIDVFQNIIVQSPAGDYDETPRLHRPCSPSIEAGYAIVSSPPMPLTPLTAPEGRYKVRAEAITKDGRRIFCVEGDFDVTT